MISDLNNEFKIMTHVRSRFQTLLPTALLALLVTTTLFAEVGPGKFNVAEGLPDLIGKTPSGQQVTVKGRFILDKSQSKGYLQVKAYIADHWHIYSITQPQGVGAPLRTSIHVGESSEFKITGPFTPLVAPTIKRSEYVSVPIEEHAKEVVWSAPIELTAGSDPSSLLIRGEVDGQVCEDEGVCMQMSSMDTTFVAAFDPSTIYEPPVVATSATTATPMITPELVKFIFYGFAGGMILNLMPCVLPVIGLKVMSFASQAGESRSRVIALNLTYVGGIVVVFIALAALAAFAGWGWGEQFQRPEFGIALAAIVFVFGLSFLGIWEIPIPGFVGSGSAMAKAESEGMTAAFLKGILTTLLATPCGGPLIAPALTWAATQSSPVIFGTFISMGLGMGSPYLAISLFPNLINRIPRPGPWMDTFKQIMGFVMMGTVVWILSFIAEDYVVPTVALLFVLWAACWWINRTPITAPLSEKIGAFVSAGLFAAIVGTAAFWALAPSWTWPEYSDQELASLQQRGVTVLVDFTADY